MIEISHRINRRYFSELSVALEQELQQAVSEVGRIQRDLAREMAPVKTGALQASIYLITSTSFSSYQKASVAAASRAAFGGMKGYATTSVSRPDDPYTAIVVAGAYYARFVEYGTFKMAGRFFMSRAATLCRPIYRARTQQAVRNANRRAAGMGFA